MDRKKLAKELLKIAKLLQSADTPESLLKKRKDELVDVIYGLDSILTWHEISDRQRKLVTDAVNACEKAKVRVNQAMRG